VRLQEWVRRSCFEARMVSWRRSKKDLLALLVIGDRENVLEVIFSQILVGKKLAGHEK
jgi:hypothetical protein